MNKLFLIIIILICDSANGQNVFEAIERFDTLSVNSYINNGGNIDAVKIKKVQIKKYKKNKIETSIFENCIAAIHRASDDFDIGHLEKAYRNLDLFIEEINKSKNKQAQLDRLFTLSISLGNVELSRKIHSLGAKLNYKCYLCYGRTPILIALSYNDNIEMIRFLLSLKPDLSATDFDGKGFLHYACQNKNYEMVKYFTENKLGNLNLKDDFGRTPIIYAAQNNDFKIYNYLLEHGASVNIIDKKGMSLLHVAAQAGNSDFFRHVHYTTGLELWTRNLRQNDVLKYCDRKTAEGDLIYLYISRYTIEKYGGKYYKKCKQRMFLKRIIP